MEELMWRDAVIVSEKKKYAWSLKFDPEMLVLLVQVGHIFQTLFNMTEGTENSENIFCSLSKYVAVYYIYYII